MIISKALVLTFGSLHLLGTLYFEPVHDLEDLINEVSAERLSLKTNGSEVIRVRSLSDLQGQVVVRSGVAALEFVRIDSNPFTFNMFGKGQHLSEIVRDSDVHSMLMGLPRRHLLWVGVSGVSGVLSGDEWSKLSYCGPTVREVRDGWHIRRLVLRRTSAVEESYQVIWVEEHVGRKGEFKREFAEVVDPKSPFRFGSMHENRYWLWREMRASHTIP